MRLNREKLLEIFQGFKNLKVLVVGDLILDRYLFGKVERISPEAPVPIVEVEREEFRLGGAGNVASNLRALGVETYLCGVVGVDYASSIIRGLLKEKGVKDLVVEDLQRPTTEKTRIISMSQQLLRIDSESKKKIEGEVLKKVLERLDIEVDGIIVSDYAKGVVCKEVMDRVKEKEIFFSIDPRPINKELYMGAYLMTPNEKEAKEMQKEDNLEALGWKLKEELKLKTLIITLGAKGMALFDKEFKVFPARAKQVYDVTGAGDTVIAVLSACSLLGIDWELSCELANVCAGIVVGKLGAVSPTPEEILEYVDEGKEV